MSTHTELVEERDSLERQLHRHRKNLFQLEEQKAMYGIAAPLHILNGIDAAEEEIERIQARLREIEGQLESLPPEPEPPGADLPPPVKSAPQPQASPVKSERESSLPSVFISYSHKDETEKEELVSHLGVLQGEGLVDVWVDDRIGAGSAWAEDIDRAMRRARVAILLITKNFLNSKFILQTEVPRLLERHRDEGVVVFPVIARPCAWRRVEWLARMNVRPKNGTPVWREGGHYVDEDLAAIAEEVADILAQAS